MTEKDQRDSKFFERAVEYCERLLQIMRENPDIGEELPPSTKEEVLAILAPYQDIDPDFRQSLFELCTSEPDRRFTVEAYAERKTDDLLRRKEEIIFDYDQLHEDTDLVAFLKTDFYYEAAIFEWQALMLVLRR